MRYILLFLALIGALDSGFALREHYRTGVAPCDINARWDCGVVNHSPYAVMGGVPVADIGIVGYLFLAFLAFRRRYRLMLAASLLALAFSLYLAHIEASILGVWCVYCAISLGLICLLTILVLGTVIFQALRRNRTAAELHGSNPLSS
ncbi:MAG TPA: vitamin K epoxide reductase family protein [Candidatus Angelobacter sp.]|nr:vitamin K epoxide reductase family protein [Candidatus Angelobacter sp.]